MSKYCPKCGTKNDENATFCRKCGYNFGLRKKKEEMKKDDTNLPHSRMTRRQPNNNGKKRIGILICLLVLIVFMGVLLYNQSTSNKKVSSGSSSSTSSSSQQRVSQTFNKIEGGYEDRDDGAALNINSDGTGRYVYYDTHNSNTDDTFTWSKAGKGKYKLNFDDDDITAPVIAKQGDNGTLILSSNDSDWDTEVFAKSKNKIDLDKYLEDAASESLSSDVKKFDSESISRKAESNNESSVNTEIINNESSVNTNGDVTN